MSYWYLYGMYGYNGLFILQIVLFSMHRREVLLQQALREGVRGYVLKASAVEDILSAIRAVHKGQYFLSPEIETDMISGYLGRGQGKECDGLSERELEVLIMVVIICFKNSLLTFIPLF